MGATRIPGRIIGTLRDGRIARMQEYVDSAHATKLMEAVQAAAARGWSPGVAAENFNNAEVSTFNAEVYGPGNYRQYPMEPRLVFGWLRWAF